MDSLALGMLVATALPLLALYLIHRLDLYATSQTRNVLLCLGWGILSTQLALLINSSVTSLGILGEATVTQRVAPPVEEVAKVLIIAYLVYRPRFTYFVDGAIYGFAVGIGFAVVENSFYLSRAGDAALGLAFARVLSTNLMHGAATAISGIVLALARFQPERGRRYGMALLGLLAAIVVHLAFNGFVGRFAGSAMALYALAATFGLAGAAGVALAIRLGLRQERRMIGSALDRSGRVARGEREAVDQLAAPEAILAPIERQFGPQKAEAVRALLALQARLGILQETADRLPDASRRRARELEIARLHRDMDQQRRAIGAFCMLHLRGIAEAAEGSIWEGFASTEDRDSDAGIWQLLGERLTPPAGLGRLLGATPGARRLRALLAFLGLSALIWGVPPLVDTEGLLAATDRLSLQILLQWLASLALLAARDRSRRDLWARIDARVASADAGSGLRRRLLGKGARLVFALVVVAISAAIWLAPRWLPAAAALASTALAPVQVLLQLWVLASAASLLGRLRWRIWLLTSLALAADLYQRWPGPS